MALTILDHINAGHYPVDDKGRALVRMEDGGVATIVATDAPGGQACPILGWDNGAYRWWNRVGTPAERGWAALLPPSPRKVKVTKYYRLLTFDGRPFVDGGVFDTAKEAGIGIPGRIVIEISGEYEEPWT